MMVNKTVEYWMRHPGYEILALEPSEMTEAIIERLTKQQNEELQARSSELEIRNYKRR